MCVPSRRIITLFLTQLHNVSFPQQKNRGGELKEVGRVYFFLYENSVTFCVVLFLGEGDIVSLQLCFRCLDAAKYPEPFLSFACDNVDNKIVHIIIQKMSVVLCCTHFPYIFFF